MRAVSVFMPGTQGGESDKKGGEFRLRKIKSGFVVSTPAMGVKQLPFSFHSVQQSLGLDYMGGSADLHV